MSDSEHTTVIVVVDNTALAWFEIRVGDDLAGFAEYRRYAGGIEFTHTEIADAYEGRGLGSRLAVEVLDRTRQAGLLVTPSCPFIAGYIRRHPEYADLVDPHLGEP